MKRILLILTLVASFSVLANNGEETNGKSVKITKAPVSNTGDFPNPILKLWNFFIRDYKKVTIKEVKKTKSDTTVFLKERYFFK